MRPRVTLLVLTFASALASPVRADSTKKLSAEELAGRIDHFVAARWADAKAAPAAPADDAEWVRRLTLDLNGRIPDILSARDFIEDPSSHKRGKLIDRLLESDRYAAHWANVWRNWWLSNTGDVQNAYFAASFEAWLLGELKKNATYDHLVREILTAGPQRGFTGAFVFYQANQQRIENVAATSSRLFLGVKLECAQCHNHPFAKWKKQQFWEYAAFFGEVSQPQFDPNNPRQPIRPYTPGEVPIPGTDKVAKATFLDGKAAAVVNRNARGSLASWMTAKDNPYFARAAVNRVWEYLLGVGLVEPVDEECEANPASHPELLDELATQFARNDYDLKYLLKAITLSRAYGLSSKQTHATQSDARLFARMVVRGLSPEQLYDSLNLATGHKEEDPSYDVTARLRNVNLSTPRADFLRRFPNQDKRSEQQTSILQALFLMNGKLVSEATSLEHNENLRIVARAERMRTSRKVEQLYLITLARKPTAAESSRLVRYVDSGGPKKDPARALCDVFWALLNSSEFCTNH